MTKKTNAVADTTDVFEIVSRTVTERSAKFESAIADALTKSSTVTSSVKDKGVVTHDATSTKVSKR